jgi:hypothetical protein
MEGMNSRVQDALTSGCYTQIEGKRATLAPIGAIDGSPAIHRQVGMM